MNNKQLAKRFAEGATSGKASNMFIEGDTIYSYGYHFKIAQRLNTNDIVIVNSDSYSNSTSKHQGHVRGYLNYDYIIEAPGCRLQDAGDYLLAKIAEAELKMSRAILDYTRDYWQQRVSVYKNQLNLLRSL